MKANYFKMKAETESLKVFFGRNYESPQMRLCVIRNEASILNGSPIVESDDLEDYEGEEL